jgi:hypothetical protein
VNDIPADLITMRAAARCAGNCHLSTVHRWVQGGALRGWRRRGRWFVSRADVLSLFVERADPVPRVRTRRTSTVAMDAELRELGLL